MVSDDELERHVNRVETNGPRRPQAAPTLGSDTADGDLSDRVDAMQAAARETHSELSRRIRNVDDASAEAVRDDRLAERMDDIERRLAAIEEELAD
jgi:polyhydroxyalkanoate synthesis regulator phasin